jgi:hypothetical protein
VLGLALVLVLLIRPQGIQSLLTGGAYDLAVHRFRRFFPHLRSRPGGRTPPPDAVALGAGPRNTND